MKKFSKLIKKKANNEHVPPLVEAATELKPGDMPIKRQKRQLIQPAEIRKLRELIRYRYALDVEIWGDRNVKDYQKDRANANMRKSIAALASIRKFVEQWDKREYFSNDGEYAKFRELKKIVLEDGKRDWARHPPWDKSVQNGGLNSIHSIGPDMLDQTNYS